MAVKDMDERHNTKKGQIRVERWVDNNGNMVRYNMAYINTNICSVDNGRVLGFDNAHTYPGFTSLHHKHWMGTVAQGDPFISFEDTLLKFEQELGYLKQKYQKDY